ncbi:MAG: hypothetical protein NT018_08725, partial [Armatimonadetes bacterium]|nr:hypothetical protein [Armatimonadota bacterium]
WPMRLSFALTEGAINTIADRLEKRQSVASPFQLGLLRIKRAEISSKGVVCLWTDMNPGGRSGFVKTSATKVDSQFNLWSKFTLDKDWQFISED